MHGFWQVEIDLRNGLEDSLAQLKLESGVANVEKLNVADMIWEVLPYPRPKFLHIVVENPHVQSEFDLY